MSVAAPEPLWDVVEEHLDEAEFLWEQWEHALVAPHYTLDELADGPEARLLAHLDGLVVGGPAVARRLLIPTLEEDVEPTRVRAAALALLLAPGAAGLDAVLAALHEVPALRPELARALACSDHPDLLPRTRALLDHPELATTAARVLAAHHQPLGPHLRSLLSSDDPADRALALANLAFEAGPPRPAKQLALALQALTAADPEERDAALTAGVLLGLPPAWQRAQELAGAPGCARALLLLGVRGQPDDEALLVAALARPEQRAAALFALGFVGTVTAVEAALGWLDDAEHGPLAGEVLSSVTGLDLEDADLTAPADDADEPLEHRPEHDLPRPEPISTLLWWTRNAGRFAPDQRLLRGEPLTPATLIAQLHHGPMRRRPALLLDLLLRTGTHNRLALDALSARQRLELARLTPI